MPSGRGSVFFAFALALSLALAYVARSVLILVYVSIVFAVVLTPAVEAIQRLRIGGRHPGRGLALGILIAVTLAAVSVFLLFALPPLVSDIQSVASGPPAQGGRIAAWLNRLPFGRELNPQTFGQYAGKIVGAATTALSGAASALAGVFTVLLLTAYLILDGSRIFAWAMSLVPVERRGRLDSTLRRGAAKMRRWIVGQAMLMLILGSASAVVFGLLGIRCYFLLAVFAGVSNIVPVVGPILTVLLAGAVAAIDSLGKLIGVLVFYFVYQQVENAILTPHIMQSQVKLSPVAVIVALLLGSTFAGVPGALVAVPTAALVSVLVDEYAVRRERALRAGG